ncbi:MAG: type 2 lanthipeptide synthetase LanM [Vicinamibacterales bacterium]
MREGYGWTAFAATATFTSREAVTEYYRTAGALAALAWVVRARDLQMENVVATTAGPVVIDAEMCAPPTRDVDVDELGRARVESVLTSGLVTTAHVGPAEAVFDIGGLRGDGVTPTALGRRHWHGVDTAALAVETSRLVTAPTANRVLLEGALQDPRDHQVALLDGFTRAYRFLLAHRDSLAATDGPLRGLRAARSRVLFRPSQHYGSVQYALAAPAYQTSGALRSCALDTLNRVFNLDDARPSLWPVVTAEREALDALDLPRFTVPVDGTAVRADAGPIDVAYFVRPGIDGVMAVVGQLADGDLATQAAQLREALNDGVGARLDVPLHGPPGDAVGESAWLVGEAQSLARELTRRADRGDGRWGWTRFDAMPDGWARHTVYDGTLGTAVFFAALARVTGDRAYAERAAAIARDARTLAETAPLGAVSAIGIGGGSGAGSIVYGFALLTALTGDGAALAAARRVAAGLTPEVAAAATTFDVTGGAAGSVLALLALDAIDGDGGWADRARPFGQRLLETAVETGVDGAGWPARRGRPIAGFAHGSAGIALALARLTAATGDARYHTAALRACTHERSLFAPTLGNWPVVGALDPVTGSGHSVMTAWCHGAAGIALSRVAMPGSASTALAADADLALAQTTAASLSALDQVCCGNLGRADILLTASRAAGRAALADEARALVRRVADRASRRQAYGLRASGVDYRVADPGFFRGLAGIGYVLLRAAAPDTLPSVLAFESTSPVRPSA